MGERIRLLGVVGLALLAGCSSIDFDQPKTESHTITDTGSTRLGVRAAELTRGHEGQSGFLLQSDGIEALATRLLLSERAERTIDAQYYLIGDDAAARLFVEFLLRAADRGVRVRLLLDDILARDYDQGMAALASHPNFEMRIFNPFPRRGLKRMSAAGQIRRINRRMHNKTFTVDNQITIIGGRNIAAEYFAAHDDVNFGDLDAVAIGPIVEDVSRQFDLYWNDEYALPVEAFVKPLKDPEAALAAGRARLVESREKIARKRYAGALRRAADGLVDLGPDAFTWADYELIYDQPGKARAENLDEDEVILTPLTEALVAAERELIVVSPYFVPTRGTIELAAKMVDRGVKITVITNSLASNNHNLVHSGYAPVRKPLLEHGVEIYEVRADAQPSGVEHSEAHLSEGTLHTKAFLIDRKVMFLGSFNFDPRSAYINTELGVIIRSPKLAGDLAQEIDEVLGANTYRVVLNDSGKLRWITEDEGEEVIYTKEPGTTGWTRFKVRMMGLLPVKGQL